MIKWNSSEVEKILQSNFSNEGFVHPDTDCSIAFESCGLHHELYIHGSSGRCWIRSATEFPIVRPLTEFSFRCDFIEVIPFQESVESEFVGQIRFHYTEGSNSPSDDTIRFVIHRISGDYVTVWGVVGSRDPDGSPAS